METSKKYRKCPHCKSTKGFSVDVSLGGFHTFEVTFGGRVTHQIKNGADTMERYASCLSCGKSIPVENLKTDSI